MADAREAWITGIGIVSCLGEGSTRIGRLCPKARSRRTPKASRPMSCTASRRSISTSRSRKRATSARWSRGSASAPMRPGSRSTAPGVKGNAELLARMDMIVAAGGGERDAQGRRRDPGGRRRQAAKSRTAFLNERLMNDLRPTLFLAQLSNLLAGNISIVHGVTGSSRTFMGEEAAGVDAVRVALARIAAGQSDIALVGGAYNAERWEVMLHFALGRRLRAASPAASGSAPKAAAWSSAPSGHFWCSRKSARARARRQAVRAHCRGRLRSREARTWRRHGGARAHVGRRSRPTLDPAARP